MTLNQLIRLYRNTRIALLISVPTAVWGFMLWLSQGEMLPSLLFGIGALIVCFGVLPGEGEVRRTLRTRQTSDHIWYMIESRDSGEIRVCR